MSQIYVKIQCQRHENKIIDELLPKINKCSFVETVYVIDHYLEWF